jgi:hypothetical protein
MPARAIEGAAVAALGGVLGAFAGGLIGELLDLRTPLAVAGAAIGVLNGAVSGYRQIYDWKSSHGPVAVVLDSTWALPMTAGAIFTNLYGMAVPKSGYLADLSERQNRHVYRRGFVFRKGFAVTIGNVIGGAGDVERDRRRRLITDHEDVHVWQARWFGLLYPIFYGGWFLFGSASGLVVWLARGRREKLKGVVETTGYYMNPYEWWAYSRDDHWPPGAKLPGIGWSKPCVQPLAEVRRLRAGREDRTTPS